MARVVVVGGGLGGSASAARLAKQGHTVTLVERLDHVGGALGYVEQDGFRWDSGPSSTALPAVLRDLFRKSGRPLERELELVPLDPMREHRFEDGTVLPLPSGSRAAQYEAIESAMGGDLVGCGIAELALQRGGHIHVGLETYAGPRRPTNAELITEVVALAEKVGRAPVHHRECADFLGFAQ